MLTKSAMGLLDGIWRANIRYAKAGVMLTGLTTQQIVQADLFSASETRQSEHDQLGVIAHGALMNAFTLAVSDQQSSQSSRCRAIGLEGHAHHGKPEQSGARVF